MKKVCLLILILFVFLISTAASAEYGSYYDVIYDIKLLLSSDPDTAWRLDYESAKSKAGELSGFICRDEVGSVVCEKTHWSGEYKITLFFVEDQLSMLGCEFTAPSLQDLNYGPNMTYMYNVEDLINRLKTVQLLPVESTQQEGESLFPDPHISAYGPVFYISNNSLLQTGYKPKSDANKKFCLSFITACSDPTKRVKIEQSNLPETGTYVVQENDSPSVEIEYYYNYEKMDLTEKQANNLEYSYLNKVLTITGNGAIRDFEKGEKSQPWRKYQEEVAELRINEGITRVGNRAFQSFKKLEKVSMADSVKSVGQWAFQNCIFLSDVEMSEDILLEKGAFRNTRFEEILLTEESQYYLKSPFYTKLLNTQLTGNLRDDVIEIAKSQIGYHEGNNIEDICGLNAAGDQNISEYGRSLGNFNSLWCSEFASWCVRMAGVPIKNLSSSGGANAEAFTKGTPSRFYEWKDTIYGGGSYTPRKADIILWAWNHDKHEPDESLSHTSLLESIKTNNNGTLTFYLIEGNSGDVVKEKEVLLYSSNGYRADREGQLVYIVAPDYESRNPQFHVNFESDGYKLGGKDVIEGAMYGALPIPTLKGKEFDGWYSQKEGGSKITMYTEVKETPPDILYAHWK